MLLSQKLFVRTVELLTFSPAVVPGSIFFEIRRYFCKIAGHSVDTVLNLQRAADAPISLTLQ